MPTDTSKGSPEDRWYPGFSLALEIALPQVQQLLGASRCGALKRVCCSWTESLQLHQPVPRHSLLDTLSPVSENLLDELQAEDDLYLLKSAGIPDLLSTHADISNFDEVRALVAALRPRCRLPEVAVDILFQPQVERDRTLYLAPRPLHCAVMHSSLRLLRMLLRAAKETGVLQEACGNDQPGAAALTPTFLAVLFASQEVGDVLVEEGIADAFSCELDVQAACKLQRRGLWPIFQERANSLGLGDFAAKLSLGMQAHREKVAKAREAIRAALRS